MNNSDCSVHWSGLRSQTMACTAWTSY